MALLRRCQSFSDTFDTVSESWCSVHYSPQRPTFADTPMLPLSPEPAHQRVATWLEQQHSEAMQPAAAASHTTCRRRSLSEVSLADFLRCAGPHRPSFLDQNSRSRVQETTHSKRRVGWVASKLSEKHKDDDSALLSAGNYHKQHPRPRFEEKEAEEELLPTADTDAEFLSHVLSHFVAFQPLDFPRASAALADQHIDPADTPAKDSGGLWAYLSGALGELTRDVTFIQ
ncbi:hypothetical protein GGH94_000538 [Coemansia aciculifera]|uniref:Uncharacterized protein n=1 Tax=Coemansia aciculifera TaxID=417176 RepID=A0A9W8IQH0_9FUNG|nr:hypothetical protein GGH94_000538 [Coemansia aciculifera]KAJ2876829.1 hypothetical protein GGH93_000422 [Coemansia aciculifera]